jgi:hypothetical protein
MALKPIEPGQSQEDIRAHLPHSKIFHFAGHGFTDNDDPPKSHLLLGDEQNAPLTVATLLEMNIRKNSPFLAYLSACGTGQIMDKKFFDESIHLISAFQLVGFRHVVGTLWEVNVDLCVDMARITYEGIKDGDMDDNSVCRGLHNATRELRDRWLDLLEKAKLGNRLVRKAKGKTKARSTSNGGERLPRDADLSDEDEDECKGTESLGVPSHWVPYVHYGV